MKTGNVATYTKFEIFSQVFKKIPMFVAPKVSLISAAITGVVSKTFDFTNLKQEKVSLSFKFNF